MMSKVIYFDFSTVFQQIFPFPPDVIKYMIKNCNASTWLKFTKSCKYFFAKHNALVLKSTTLDQYGCITATDRSIYKYWESVDELSYELFLAGKLTISASLASFKPKIPNCKLRELNIAKMTLEFEEFGYLVKSDILDTLRVIEAEIQYSDESVVPLEVIFEALPNVTCLTFDCNKATNAQTFRRMAETSRNRKLISYNFIGILNIKEEDFVLFSQNHAARNCTITLGFISPEFETILEKMLIKWEPKSTKPRIMHEGIPIPRPQVPIPPPQVEQVSTFNRNNSEAFQRMRRQVELYNVKLHLQLQRQREKQIDALLERKYELQNMKRRRRQTIE